MSSLSRTIILFVIAVVLAMALGQSVFAAGLDVGGALNKAKDAVQAVTQTTGAVPVPTSAAEHLRRVDQSLTRTEEIMGEKGANYDKDYRSKEAASRLQEAKDGMKTVEDRYGAKMGKDHPELVSRRDRITAMEAKVKAFQAEMAGAMKKDEEARDTAQKNEAAEQAAREEKNAAEAAKREEDAQKAQAAATETPVGGGKIVFSESPIDPASPANLTNEFQAGDNIYGLILIDKTWRELYQAGEKTELGIMVGLAVNGYEDYQYITLKKPQYIEAKSLVLEIAPSPDKMTSYKDPDMLFGEGKGNRKIGPIAFTYDLAQLPAGKHTVKFYVRNYGEHPAVGEFTIEGADFKFYADLHEKVKGASDAVATLPAAGMINKELEGQMRALLENAGWTNILRVVIIDKDWWVEGNTRRYLNVAAAAKDSNGQCYWCNTQFSQPKLIDGSWGKLELTSTGIKRTITEENVNK